MNMEEEHPRMQRERKTMEVMIKLYCSKHHESDSAPCQDCAELLSYANLRLDKCPFQEEKPTCAKCTVHCYTPSRREEIRTVMRYSGPRMLYKSPVLALKHMGDRFKKPPKKASKRELLEE